MDLNVLYRLKEEQNVFMHLKPLIEKNTIQMVYFVAFPEFFYSKKVIWCLKNIIRSQGVVCIKCSWDSVSDILKVCQDSFVAAKPVICPPNEIYVVANNKGLIEYATSCIVSCDNILEHFLNMYSKAQDYILTIGSPMIEAALMARNRCRYVISFGGSEYFIRDGMRIVDLE